MSVTTALFLIVSNFEKCTNELSLRLSLYQILKNITLNPDTTVIVDFELYNKWELNHLTSKFLILGGASAPKNSNFLKKGSEVYLVEFGTFEEASAIVENLKRLEFWDLRSRFLLIYHGSAPIEEIFKFFWNHRIYHLTIAVVTARRLLLHFWFPYYKEITTRSTYSPKNLVLLKEVPKMLVPNPLRVRVVQFPPYIISETAGSDVQIIKELASFMGTEVVVSQSSTPFDFGSLLPNKTVTGMFGAAYYETVDLSIGGFILASERYALLDSSYPYHNEKYDWCVPRAQKIPSWKLVFETMEVDTWVPILVAYFLVSLVLWRLSSVGDEISYFRTFGNWLFTDWAVLVGASANVVPERPSTRFFTLFWVMICLILDTMYSTKFISLLEVGVEEAQISSRDQLLASGLEIQMKTATVNFFGESPTLKRFILRGYHTCGEALSCMEKVVFGRNSSVLVSQSFISYIRKFFVDDRDRSLVFCFASGVDIVPIFIGMRKGFALKEHVDGLLKRFVEGGFINFWRKQTFLGRKITENGKSTVIKAPLFCWIVGISVAGVVFSGEIIFGRRN